MITIDLSGDNVIEIGATYVASFTCCGLPDLTDFTGTCQVRLNNTSVDVLLTPTVTVIDKDKFSININYAAYPPDLVAGTYQYDVLFSKNDNSQRFYAIGGKAVVVKRITIIP